MKKFNLAIILILTCSVFIYSCESVKTYYVEKENIPKDENIRIAGVFLKSGEYLDLRNKNPKLVLNGELQVINYDKDNLTKAKIRVDSISALKIEISRNNYWMPVVIIAGVVIVLFIGLMIAIHEKGFVSQH